MRTKALQVMLLCTSLFLLATALPSCKGKIKDADISTAINEKIKTMTEMSGLTAAVKDGVVTLTGECKDEACKTVCETAVKAIAGVKSVVNNCTIAPPPAPAVVVPEANVDALTKAINDAVKDFPGVKTALNDGVLTLTGEVAKDKLQKLMMGLNALKAMGLKKIESAGLTKK
ncbi:MAG: hypothetical protein RLZZ316_635 [Bacteroidota bacterium]|jgi:osmotically-inducible protein OsmY